MAQLLLKRLVSCAVTVAVAAALAGCGQASPEELLASGQEFLKKEDPKAAAIQFKAALQHNPQSAQVRFLLGKALLESGDPLAALVEFEKALDLKHHEDELLPLLAQTLVATGQVKKVTDLYGQKKLGDPIAHASLRASVAAAYGAQGEFDLCRVNVEQALHLDPTNVVARLLQAQLAAGRGEFDLALALVETLLAEQPRELHAWRLKGEILWIARGDAAAGAEAFEQALRIAPGYMPSHSALIALALQQRDVGRFKLRVAALKKAQPHSPETRMYEAQGALIDNDIRAAREITQQLLRFAPDNVRVLQLAGTVEMRDGGLAQAERHLSKALQFEPRLAVARRLLAQVYVRSGQPARALSTLQPLLNEPNPSSDVLATAAEAHLHNGQLAESEQYFRQAAKINPDDTKVLTALALAQIAKGDTQRGFADLQVLAARDPSAYPDLALISSQLLRKDYNGALVSVERLQTKQPDAALPHQLRASIMIQRKDLAAAREGFEKALVIDPNYFPALQGLAALDVEAKQFDRAIKRFEELLAREPSNFRALMALAEVHQRSGAPPQAIRALLSDAVSANKAEAAPRLLLIEHLLNQKEVSAAKAAAQEAALTFPNDPQVLDALGRSQLAAGELQQAISTFGKLTAAHPASAAAHQRLAEAFFLNRDFTSAARSLSKALELDPKLLPAQRGLIQVATAQNRIDEALAIARSVQKQRPKEALGNLLESDIYASQRQWNPALAALRVAMERERSTLLAMRMHNLYTLAGRATDAKAFAATWLREQPNDGAFILHLGMVAMDDKDHVAAEQRFRDYLALNPEDPGPLNNLAWVLLQQGKPGALVLAEKANHLAPDRPPLMDTLAAALAANGQLLEAIEWQRKALSKATETAAPEYRLRLAKLLLQQGDKAAARNELETLQRLGRRFPSHAEVRELLAKTAS